VSLLRLVLGPVSSLLLFVLLLLKLLKPSILSFLDSIRSGLLDLALLIILFLDHILDLRLLMLDFCLLVLDLVMSLLLHLLGLEVAVGARLAWGSLRSLLSFDSALSLPPGWASGALGSDARWPRWSLGTWFAFRTHLARRPNLSYSWRPFRAIFARGPLSTNSTWLSVHARGPGRAFWPSVSLLPSSSLVTGGSRCTWRSRRPNGARNAGRSSWPLYARRSLYARCSWGAILAIFAVLAILAVLASCPGFSR